MIIALLLLVFLITMITITSVVGNFSCTTTEYTSSVPISPTEQRDDDEIWRSI
jgi:hypothetical protein